MKKIYSIERLTEGFVITTGGKRIAMQGYNELKKFMMDHFDDMITYEGRTANNGAVISIEIEWNVPQIKKG